MRRIIIFIGVVLLSGFAFFSCQSNMQNTNNQMPENLEGVALQYAYSGGNAYHVKLEKKGLSYQFLSGSRPDILKPFRFSVFERSNFLF